MYYYDPNDRQPRRWAAIAAGAYALVLAVSFAVVSFDFSPALEKPGDTILVDFTEPPAPEPPRPRVKPAAEPRVHDETAPVEQTAQAAGKDEVTQTPNPRALFKMNKGGVDEPTMRAIRGLRRARTRPPARAPGSIPTDSTSWTRGSRGAAWSARCPNPTTRATAAARSSSA